MPTYQPLSEDQKRAYKQALEAGDGTLAERLPCPHCGASPVHEIESEADNHPNTESFVYGCAACGREWVVVLGIVDIQDEEQLCPSCHESIEEDAEIVAIDGELMHAACHDLELEDHIAHDG